MASNTSVKNTAQDVNKPSQFSSSTSDKIVQSKDIGVKTHHRAKGHHSPEDYKHRISSLWLQHTAMVERNSFGFSSAAASRVQSPEREVQRLTETEELAMTKDSTREVTKCLNLEDSCTEVKIQSVEQRQIDSAERVVLQ